MRPSISPTLRVVILLTACAALVTGAQAGSNDSELAIAAVEVRDSQVRVTVANSGSTPQTASVVVQVRLADGTEAAAMSAVTVFGRQKAFVDLPLPSSVEIVLGVILDDGSPY